MQAFLRGYGDFEESAMMTLTRPWLIIPGLDCDEHSYHVIEGRQVLGRSPWCDFRLNHPTVSSRHAELLLCGESLSVRDLGSRNGTYLDDMRIERATLDVGQSLRLGLVILQVADCPLPDDQPGTAVLPPKHPGTLEQKAKDLSPAQLRVMHLLIEGFPEKAIAGRLFLSPSTIHSHITAIYRQLDVHSRSELLCRYVGEPAR
jgi:DNA-binding CsgD family transcriptional regulator